MAAAATATATAVRGGTARSKVGSVAAAAPAAAAATAGQQHIRGEHACVLTDTQRREHIRGYCAEQFPFGAAVEELLARPSSQFGEGLLSRAPTAAAAVADAPLGGAAAGGTAADAAAGGGPPVLACLPLERLHEAAAVRRVVATAAQQPGTRAYQGLKNCVDQQLKACGALRGGSPLMAAYRRFVREVVAPLVCAEEDGEASLLFQRVPNFRCHLPGTGQVLVQPHTDGDYHHSPNEINFWVPLTLAWGSNTLWRETAPGREDFRPFELEPGQMAQFHSSACVHYTVPNETGRTRVSFDFRVVPRSRHRPTWPGSTNKKGGERYAVGQYWDSLELQPPAPPPPPPPPS